MNMTPERAQALVRAALPAYGLDPLVPLELIKQRENTVFRASTPQGELAVRLHRQGYHPDADVAAELGLVQLLEAAGVPVPHFLSAVGGQHFTVVSEEGHGEHQVDVQRWINGAAPLGDSVLALAGTADVDLEQWRQLGALAASSHVAIAASQAAGRAPECGGRVAWDVDGLVGERPAWGDPLRLVEMSQAERGELLAGIEVLRAQLAGYGKPEDRYGPIHADFTVENVMSTPEGLVLIDFDDFAAGWHLFDVATMLFFFGPHPRYQEIREAALAGYTAVRPLRQADLDVLDALIFGRGLTYLGWAADRRGEPEAEHVAMNIYPHVLHLARALTARTA